MTTEAAGLGLTEVRPRPCLVCQQPCSTEGQLCPKCAAAGCRVTDDAVFVTIEVDLPDWMEPA